MAKRTPLRLILCGARGRMGSRVAALASADAGFFVLAGVVRGRPSPSVHPFPTMEEKELPGHIRRADVLIDFSTAASSVRFAQAAARHRTPIVIGTTGFSPTQTARIRAAAQKTAVFLSPNFSPGMNLLFHLAERAAAALPEYDAGILEVHHARKKDSPSGTALRLAAAVRRGRPGADVPIVSQRLGSVVGDHALTLAGPSERIELSHRAESRDAFGRGALAAARWLRWRAPGLYGMEQLLGLAVRMKRPA